MNNYALLHSQKDIINKFEKNFPLDICLITYNRLEYLKRCVWSIIASTSVPYRLFVRDDGSTDGTKEWLIEMKCRGLITHFANGNNVGTANSANKIISISSSPLFIIIQDDMYLFRNWDYAVVDIYMRYEDAGLITFYDYARLGLNGGVKEYSDTVHKVIRTGMGCTAIDRKLFECVKGFNLQKNRKMGYFASSFCEKTSRTKLKRKFHYITVPNYAVHMDNPNHLMCERKQLKEYNVMRIKEKRGKSQSSYMNEFKE